MKMLVMSDLTPIPKEKKRIPSKTRVHRRAVKYNDTIFDSVTNLAKHLGFSVQYVYRLAQSTAEKHNHIQFVVGKYG